MLKQRFDESYRILKDTCGAILEIGTEKYPFLYRPVSCWFSEEMDARIAADLIRDVLELADEFNCRIYDEVIEVVGDAKLDDIMTTKMNKAREPVANPTCPFCGNYLIKRAGKYGDFWQCSDYPKCHAFFDDDNGSPKPKIRNNLPRPK